jgi:hypothetical protein
MSLSITFRTLTRCNSQRETSIAQNEVGQDPRKDEAPPLASHLLWRMAQRISL